MKPHILIEDLKVGDRFTLERETGPDAVRASVEFGQDFGGYHVDEGFARAAGFRTVITSGVFHVTLIAALTGHINLLGREMNVRFRGPIYAGDRLQGTAEVVALNRERREVTLDIGVVNQDGVQIVEARVTGFLPAAGWGVPKRRRLPELDG